MAIQTSIQDDRNAQNEKAQKSTPGSKIHFDRKAVNQRWDRLRIEGWKWRPAWRELRDFIAPTRGMFEMETPNLGKRIDHERIVNGKALRSLNTYASGMNSGLTSPSRPWFMLSTMDPDLKDFPPVKEWLSTVLSRMYAVLAKSNIYRVLHNVYAEGGAFGTACQMLLPDYHSVIRGRNFTIGEYFLGTGADNRVNAFARQFWMTVGQLVDEYGYENCSQSVQSMWNNNNVDAFRLVRHLIEPNDDRIVDRADFKGKAYRSVTWEEAGTSLAALRLEGYHEFPLQAPRWQTTTTADSYGRGPGWEALGDVKMLQKMEKDKLKALDKVVDPPMQSDSSVDVVNTLPGGLTRSSSVAPNAGVKPAYQIQPDFDAIDQMIMNVEKRIDSVFFADLFMMISNDSEQQKGDITAREIVERHEEKLQMLGPVIEALEFELLDPMIDRVYALMDRAGLIPPPPMDLQGHELKVEYVSILAAAQKMVGTTAIEQTARFVGSLVSVDPTVIDNLDTDKMVLKYADMTGVPPEIMRDENAVAKIRADRQKQQQAEQQAQSMERMAQGAKTLSETPVGQDSALDSVMGALTGQPAQPSAAAPAAGGR